MSATIERVSIEDVYPLVDEFGNDMASRDYSLKENQKYVAKLAESFDQETGEPDEPPVLVRDGGIYRIKTGNSRIQAMRKLGTKTFRAVIEDDSTPQEIVEAVIRTNTKKKYEAVEESRFVRQLALMNKDDYYVGKVAGIEAEKVAKVRRAAERVQDAADDMSLLRLIAIGEFEDDDHAVELLTNCSEKDFPGIEKQLRDKRRMREAIEAMETAFSERGIPVMDYRPQGLSFICQAGAPEDIPEELPDDCVAESIWGSRYNLFGTKSAEEVDPEEEARKAEAASRISMLNASNEARSEWFAAHCMEPMDLGSKASPYTYSVSNYIEEHELDIPIGPAHSIAAFLDAQFNARCIFWDGTIQDDRVDAFIELGEALEAHGYEPIPEERELTHILNEYKEAEDAR